MKKIILLSVFCVLMAMPVAGEYYQYEDSQGNLKFTDDAATIPKDTQTDITAYESIGYHRFSESLESNSSSDSTQADDSNLTSTDVGESKLVTNRKVLDEMRAALDQTAASLKARHKELSAQAPGVVASTLQTNDYFEKVDVLNADMEDYKKQNQAYNEKVRAYNAKIQSEEKKVDNANVE